MNLDDYICNKIINDAIIRIGDVEELDRVLAHFIQLSYTNNSLQKNINAYRKAIFILKEEALIFWEKDYPFICLWNYNSDSRPELIFTIAALSESPHMYYINSIYDHYVCSYGSMIIHTFGNFDKCLQVALEKIISKL